MSAWDSSACALSDCVVVGEHHPDAGADVEAAAAGDHRLLDRLHQPLGDGPHLLGGAVHEVGELVAAEPGHGVAGPHQAGQPLADHGQHQVAGAVPVPVVDHLEVVEVEQQQPERPVGPPYQRVLDAVHQQHPVRQPGERIVVGLPEQPGGQLVPLAHVVQGQHGPLEGALVELADGLHLEPAVAVVQTPDPALDEAVRLGAVHHHRADRGQHLGQVVGVHLREQLVRGGQQRHVPERAVHRGAAVGDLPVGAEDDDHVGEVPPPRPATTARGAGARRTAVDGLGQVTGQRGGRPPPRAAARRLRGPAARRTRGTGPGG